MFSTDFIFRQQENLVRQPEMSGWIQTAMQQNTIVLLWGLRPDVVRQTKFWQ